MHKYFISIFILFFLANVFAQETGQANVPKIDSVTYKTTYGLRLGIDISKPVKAIFDDTYKGFEIVGDYRISKNLYIAAEIGFEEETTNEDFTSSFAKGNYIRLGANINLYKNWLDMNNEIFFGFRYGFSIFDQTLNNYSINTGNQYFPTQIISSRTDDGLHAHWVEFQMGIKVETLNNLFVSASMAYKTMVSVKDPDNFKVLFAPGFNRVFLNNAGVGFNYTISYIIPFKKK